MTKKNCEKKIGIFGHFWSFLTPPPPLNFFIYIFFKTTYFFEDFGVKILKIG